MRSKLEIQTLFWIMNNAEELRDKLTIWVGKSENLNRVRYGKEPEDIIHMSTAMCMKLKHKAGLYGNTHYPDGVLFT